VVVAETGVELQGQPQVLTEALEEVVLAFLDQQKQEEQAILLL